MSDLRHHPVHEEVVRLAVGNLRSHFPEADVEVIRDLVSEAFVRIGDGSKAPAFVGMLAERHVYQVLDRERRADLSERVSQPFP